MISAERAEEAQGLQGPWVFREQELGQGLLLSAGAESLQEPCLHLGLGLVQLFGLSKLVTALAAYRTNHLIAFLTWVG